MAHAGTDSLWFPVCMVVSKYGEYVVGIANDVSVC